MTDWAFDTVLISNRGEIARRVIRTARRLGLRTVAVYSAADIAAPHVREADEAVCIGGARPQDSYLNGSSILTAAKSSGAGELAGRVLGAERLQLPRRRPDERDPRFLRLPGEAGAL